MIDTLDIVSLLLGAAVAYLVVSFAAVRLKDAPAFAPILLGIGLILILGYAFSQTFHALKAAIH